GVAGLDAHLAARGLAVAWGETVFPDQAPGEPVAEVVGRLCDRLARTVGGVFRSGSVPLVLGGDHSCAMGTWRGVATGTGAPLGLLWIDGHLHAPTPPTSHPARLPGVPLPLPPGPGG